MFGSCFHDGFDVGAYGVWELSTFSAIRLFYIYGDVGLVAWCVKSGGAEMKVVVIGGENFKIEGQRAGRVAARSLARAKTILKTQAFRTKRRVQQEMPVDTGRARASWGNPVPLAEGIWEVQDGGLTIIQGSSVPYIADLNDGHSMQAPAGFIDAAAVDAEKQLMDDVANVIVREWTG